MWISPQGWAGEKTSKAVSETDIQEVEGTCGVTSGPSTGLKKGSELEGDSRLQG